ncbi:PHB depolymerase family esterase [Marivirga salinae]|uniref:PHB depolymerase family esterase n=1 Tax=Marivirga salinarum TaxID=3059078 RepID=A0AA51RCZ6_9BACT|nr:PHB depolymerase family esterase [Marivirga sp. BDSF4-3]WMN12393.1 PHB depolymerase family esterase [Marivirga sp. BDSF4-3]
MKNYLLMMLLLIMFSIICNAQETITGTIIHDNEEREYIMYIPASYDPTIASPLVLCFHGYTSSANTIMSYSGFNQIADTANFIVVYPQGTLLNGNTHWNVGGWTLNSTADDVGFTNALLDSISAEYTIDSSKVYSTGMSNGGFMSFLLACQLSERIAAVASVTGSMTPEIFNDCDPQHPTPVLQIHGNADGTVPYSGASWTKSIKQVVEYWVDFNNTTASADTTDIDDINTNDGSKVEKIMFTQGDSCSSVVHYKVKGGDHTWPGAWGNMDIKASAIVWDFISQFDINGKSECETEEDADDNEEDDDTGSIPTGTADKVFYNLKIYPNPSNSFITVERKDNASISYQITTVSGKQVLKGELKAEDKGIDLSDLEADVYVLRIGDRSVKIIKED